MVDSGGHETGYSDVVVEYLVEFTCTWLMGHCIAQSHIYPGFTGEVSTLVHSPQEPECEDYSFLDQAVENFEHCLDSIIMHSVDTPNLMHSLMRLMPCLL